jgi:hypothetical protein
MIGRGFKSVGWVAAVGGAALSCYMLSLRVATERADLAKVESRIISTKQQIRSLQTELGTRGRLSQLEQWNTDVLALAAPASGQFLQDEFTLARLDRRDPTLEDRAPVRLASMETDDTPPAAAAPAPAPDTRAAPSVQTPPAPAGQVQPSLVRRASFTPGQPSPAPADTRTARRIDPQLVRDVAAAGGEKKKGADGKRTADTADTSADSMRAEAPRAPAGRTQAGQGKTVAAVRAPAPRAPVAHVEAGQGKTAAATRAPAPRAVAARSVPDRAAASSAEASRVPAPRNIAARTPAASSTAARSKPTGKQAASAGTARAGETNTASSRAGGAAGGAGRR